MVRWLLSIPVVAAAVLGLGVVAVVLGLGVANPAVGTAAQDEAAAAGHPMVGSWRETISEPGFSSFEVLTAYHADGTTVGGGTTAFATGPAEVALLGPGVGVWEATGPESAAYTVEFLITDAVGSDVRRETITGVRQFSADGQSFTGELRYEIREADGTAEVAGERTESGTRMTVVPFDAMVVPDPATPTP